MPSAYKGDGLAGVGGLAQGGLEGWVAILRRVRRGW
jgi:hypothetical protein